MFVLILYQNITFKYVYIKLVLSNRYHFIPAIVFNISPWSSSDSICQEKEILEYLLSLEESFGGRNPGGVNEQHFIPLLTTISSLLNWNNSVSFYNDYGLTYKTNKAKLMKRLKNESKLGDENKTTL